VTGSARSHPAAALAVDFGSPPRLNFKWTLQLAPVPVDPNCSWNRPRVQRQPALPAGLVRTRLNCAARAASVSVPVVGFRDFAATIRGCSLCFDKVRGAQALRITHGTTSETCKVCC
jgi:hypothetical protein